MAAASAEYLSDIASPGSKVASNAYAVLARLDVIDYQPTVDHLEGDLRAEEAPLQVAALVVPIKQTRSSSKLASAYDSQIEAYAELVSARAGVRASSAQVQRAEASSRRAENNRAS